MTAFIVRVRIPDLGPTPEGAMTLYVAMASSEAEALSQVADAIPKAWAVEDVVGVALPSLVERRKLSEGSVERL